MFCLRPIRSDDLDALVTLAGHAGIGMTTLPRDRKALADKIARAEASFQDTSAPEEGYYLMVLEETATGILAGTAAVIARVGQHQPFYSYKLSTITQVCRELDIQHSLEVLHLVNDYTGATEIATLFVAPEYRNQSLGRLLSRARFLLTAEFPERFSDCIIAELRGVQNEDGRSPLWQHLGKHFFGMHFQRADFLNATRGNQFIADLMPKLPIYVTLLPEEAQKAIGNPYKDSVPAMRMLEREGFRFEGYVDIFDGGPTIQARREDIATIRDSRRFPFAGPYSDLRLPDVREYLVANTALADFRILRTPALAEPDGIWLPPDAAAALGCREGDTLRAVRW